MKASAGHILRVGVTGGIGSGKSLVCSLFERLGIPVLFADDIAKEILQQNGPVRKELKALLGPSAYLTDGRLDKEYVASRIFADVALQRRMNALVHPRVEAELKKRFRKLQLAGERIGIVEAALIYEAGYEKDLDLVIVVDAPEVMRLKRVLQRDNTTRAEVRRRMRAQWPPQRKLTKADYVVRNSGSIADLEAAVRFLAKLLQNSIDRT